MLAFRRHDLAPLILHQPTDKPLRASIGAKRNPESTRAILEAAQTILSRDGLSGFSMDAIARLAQCGKPTLYRWWPDKALLLADLHDRALPAFEVSESLPPEDRIEALSRQWIDAWRETVAGETLRGLLAEAQLSESARAILLDRGLAAYRASLTRIGASGVEVLHLLAPLLGELMLGEAGVVVSRTNRKRTTVMREVIPHGKRPAPVEVEPVEVQAEPSIRHRGEWVD